MLGVSWEGVDMQRAWEGGPRPRECCGFISLGWAGSSALEGSGQGWLAGEQFGSACGLTRRWKSVALPMLAVTFNCIS